MTTDKIVRRDRFGYEFSTVTCPQCEGEGRCAYDEPVVDHNGGGYLKEVIDTCNLCEGSGVVPREEDDDE